MALLPRLVLVVALGAAAPAAADDLRGTADEAQAMVARAIALYDEAGMAGAFREISREPEPAFRDRDLYVFVLDFTGTNAANAADARLVGQNAWFARDLEGKLFVQEMLARATPEGAWVDYRFPDPLTGRPFDKRSWVVRHDGFVFGCGIYLGEMET